MTPQESKDFAHYLGKLCEAYEAYRSIQEKEHYHLNQRGSIVEWNQLVREKNSAFQFANHLNENIAGYREKWAQLGGFRTRPDFSVVREMLARLQSLLTRILTCDRINETLLYKGGYLQAVVAYRSSTDNAPATP